MARTLIAGCGYVGSALAAELVADGHPVWGMRRNIDALPAEVHPLLADLSVGRGLSDLPEVEHVVYCASADASSEKAYRRAYVDGLMYLVDALSTQQVPVERLVFTSSTAVYGQSDGRWVDETSDTFPTHFSGRILLEAERALLTAPFPSVTIRLAGIYGPGRHGLIRKVHEGSLRATERVFGNRFHRDDCAGAIRHLLELDHPDQLYLGVDDAPVSLREVGTFIAHQLDVSAPKSVPPGEEDGGRRGRSNKRCKNDRLEASGYTLRYPTYQEGYPPIVEEYLASLRSDG